ncbi:MAG: repair protein RadC [Bacteroidota bacterium]
MPSNFFSEAGKPWSPAKLLSYVLNGGAKYQSVDELATNLENHFTDFFTIDGCDESALQTIKGIGPIKARQIRAVLELHHAFNAPREAAHIVRKSQDAFDYFHALRALGHEEFHVLFLNRAHKPLRCVPMFTGGLTGTVTDVRLILKQALQLSATSIIVAHNHPSGALVPSENDKEMTKKLAQAAKTMDIALLDHLIVVRSGYFSFSDQGLL